MYAVTTAFLFQAAPAGGGFELIIMMALMFGIMYFLVIRPQQNARKKHEAMVNAVRRGDQVVTAGGLVGKVTKAGEDAEIQVELADGIVVTVLKHTLADVKSKNQPVEPEKK